MTLVESISIFLFIFALGSLVGSFLNVVVIRSLLGEDFIWGRSRCDTCKRDLQWFELIPLLSFLVLRGKCRTCHEEIDIMHPVVEFITASLFVWWAFIGFAFFQLSAQPLRFIQPLFWLSVGIVLLIILVIDLRAYIIPDWTILSLSVMTIGYRLLLILQGAHNPQDFAKALAAGAVLLALFLFLWIITKKQGIGFGDVKLIFPLALLLGWPQAVVGTFLGFVYGAVVGVALLFFGRAQWKSALPFAPFLITGTLTALLWGDSLLRWYLNQL